MTLRKSRLSLAVNAALLAAMLPLGAQAQEADTQTLDTVEVTGTRIKGAELAGQVPVQTLTREDIERTGLTSIGDIIQELTGSGSALNTKVNSSGNFGFSANGDGIGAGSAQVDLRHLGAKRVLVLVDGKRWVNESSASGVGAATDLNTIPMALVERIEVLEDGASSLYGSDAIAGVVNIITRKNFDGFQLTLDYGQYGEGDGTRKGIDFAWGYNTDRSNLFLSLSHVDQDEVSSSDRAQSRFPWGGGSSRVPGGRFAFVDENGNEVDLTPNTGTGADPDYDGADSSCERTDDFHCFSGADAFNYAPFNYLVTPSQRTGVFGQFRFNVSDNLTWYAKALFNRRESTNRAAPEPIDLGPGSGNEWNDSVVIPVNQPFNPFGLQLDASNILTIRRRPLEAGPRVFEQDVHTTYLATGLEGQFGDNYYWDVNLAHSRNEADQDNFGSYNSKRIVQALGDPDACAAISGCTPLDIFGFGTMTPAMIQWISPTFHDRSEQTLTQFTANLSGEFFDMPAGPLAFATGVEYRKYEGSYNPDPMTVAGEYNGVPSLPTEGEYDVNELYLEVNIPILKDSAWGKQLDINVAGRYSDYSTFGGEFTPKVGLRWQLVDEFTIRASYAEGFRAPSIGELFGSQSRFDSLITDPCLAQPQPADSQGNPQPPLPATGNAANCAQLGVTPGDVQLDPQISVLTGGNPTLDPEKSRSSTVGFVWSPNWLVDNRFSRKVDVEFTYYRHYLEGAIQGLAPQAQLNLCVETLDPVYCGGITRTPATSNIDDFANFLTNLGYIKTSGFDADLFWTFPHSHLGDFKIGWQNTIVAEYEAVGGAGQVQPQTVGVEIGDPGIAIPRWTSNATLDWKRGDWNASWTLRHISKLTETCGAADPTDCHAGNDGDPGTNLLQPTNYNDLQVGYRVDWMKGMQLSAGINNIFDKDPPLCTSCLLNGYEPTLYDIPGGRFWYVRMDLKF